MKPASPSTIKLILTILASVTFITLVCLILIFWWESSRAGLWYHHDLSLEQLQRIGLTGDSFGRINALFSGFALLGAIYAIYLQRIDLRKQEEEYKKSHDSNALRRLSEISYSHITRVDSALDKSTFRISDSGTTLDVLLDEFLIETGHLTKYDKSVPQNYWAYVLLMHGQGNRLAKISKLVGSGYESILLSRLADYFILDSFTAVDYVETLYTKNLNNDILVLHSRLRDIVKTISENNVFHAFEDYDKVLQRIATLADTFQIPEDVTIKEL